MELIRKSDALLDGCFDGLKEVIKRFPTIDAVPVVRCGECKYFIENTWECVRLSDRFGDEYSDARVYPEYFCADGERKEEEHEQ